jgi:translocation and assembly module TamA
VDEGYVRSKIPWKEGEPWKVDLLREARRRLTATRLFIRVEFKTGEKPDEKGYLPVVAELRERKHRTIGAGVSYQTDEGPGGRITWAHRNLFGSGERLEIGLNASGIVYAGEGQFRKPEFLRDDQSLLLSLRVAEDRPNAYTSRNVTTALQVERTLSKGMVLGAGPAYRFSRIDQFGQEDRFNLFSFPTYFNWDTSDQFLDPSRGGRLKLQMAPFYDPTGANLGFLKGYARYSRYIKLAKRPSLIFAVMGTIGAMTGAEVEEIPADIRFYSGGGGSIRGYEYQSVGPLLDGIPTGGRSLAELSAELRVKVSDKVGFVAFMDGGNVYEAEFPDFGEPFRWGIGGGLRYFTPVGPLRVDVGFPLDRREGIDDSFQFYISLGQAF